MRRWESLSAGKYNFTIKSMVNATAGYMVEGGKPLCLLANANLSPRGKMPKINRHQIQINF
jgi:hypothetical protein